MALDLFHGSIPGQSLTKPMGAMPHDNPPQYADLNDALTYMFQALTVPRQVTRLVILLRKGVPVEYIARSVIFMGFGKGKWTPDVGLMMLKSTMAMILAIAHIKKVKHIIFNPDKDQNDFLDQFGDGMQPPEQPDSQQPPAGQSAPGGAGAPPSSTPQFNGLLGGKL